MVAGTAMQWHSLDVTLRDVETERIGSGYQTRLQFALHNHGGSPLEISNIRSSCGSVVDGWTSGVLRPRETVSFSIRRFLTAPFTSIQGEFMVEGTHGLLLNSHYDERMEVPPSVVPSQVKLVKDSREQQQARVYVEFLAGDAPLKPPRVQTPSRDITVVPARRMDGLWELHLQVLDPGGPWVDLGDACILLSWEERGLDLEVPLLLESAQESVHPTSFCVQKTDLPCVVWCSTNWSYLPGTVGIISVEPADCAEAVTLVSSDLGPGKLGVRISQTVAERLGVVLGDKDNRLARLTIEVIGDGS